MDRAVIHAILLHLIFAGCFSNVAGQEPLGSLRITEIAPSSSPEWIELTNTGAASINLGGWLIVDPADADTISLRDDTLAPGHYIVICPDSADLALWHPAVDIVPPDHWSTLDNSGAMLIVSDAAGFCCDTVVYPEDLLASSSCTRLDPASPGIRSDTWIVCSDPTPGSPDFTHRWRTVRTPSMTLSPHPFSPDGDGHNDSLIIRMELPVDARADVSVLSIDGVVVRDLGPVTSNRVLWDGCDNGGRPALRGPFVVVARIRQNEVVSTLRGGGVLWR